MSIDEQLSTLFKKMAIKTPISDLNQNELPIILKFLETEKRYTEEYKIKTLLKRSGIKIMRTFDTFDWNLNPKIKKSDILEFRNSPWIEEASNLVLIGDAGLGKSHTAKSLCYDAILKGYQTVFITAFDLISKVKKAQFCDSRIEFYAKTKVLCVDEVGYTFYQKGDTDIIFQIISKRNELLPTIITTNLAPKEWGSIFSGPAASAILDRLSYNGRFITFEGANGRKRFRKS